MSEPADTAPSAPLTALERRILEAFQQELPMVPRPFAAMAERLGTDEARLLATLRGLQERGVVSRVGPVFRPHRIGASTLAAMAVPPERLDEVAAQVSARPEVNHNYAREHDYNLWFVVTGPDTAAVRRVLREVEQETGIEVLDLPMLEDYHIDLGFPLELEMAP